MTWAVGMGTSFAYAMIVSDIAVTVGRQTYDRLQKVYPTGQFMAAAFAGSVEIGFKLVQDLALCSRVKGGDPSKAVWPRIVLMKWSRRARRIFSEFPADQREHRAELLVAGIDPIHNPKERPWPKTHVATLFSPDFKPVFAPPNVPVSIGCGENVPQYTHAISSIKNIQEILYTFEVNSGHGLGNAVAQFAGRAVARMPTNGISPHMHICTVQLGLIDIKTNHHFIDDLASNNGERTMPPVAKSMDELKDFLDVEDAEVRQAVCRLECCSFA